MAFTFVPSDRRGERFRQRLVADKHFAEHVEQLKAAGNLRRAKLTKLPAGTLPNIPLTHPRLYWNLARLAYGRQQFAANPFTPNGSDALDLATAALLHPDASQQQVYARQAIDAALAYTVPDAEVQPSANGSDYYRWGQWVPVVADWCWQWMTDAERAEIITRWTGYARGVMQQSWGGPGMAFNDYWVGNLTNEITIGVLAYGTQDTSDLLNFAFMTRWQNDFLPLVNAATGPNWGGGSPDGSEYGVVSYSYPVIPWLTFPNAFGGKDWFAQVVNCLAFWLQPQPMAQGNGDSFLQLFTRGDDENAGNMSRNNYLGDYLTVAQELCAGQPQAGYAATLLGYGLPVSRYLQYGVASATPRPLAELGTDYWASFWEFWKQDWTPDGTRIMIQLDSGAEHGSDHADFGSFQVAKGNYWIAPETSGYASQFADCAANDAEPHNLVTFWQPNRPYGGYGPLRFFRQSSPVMDTLYGYQKASNDSYLSLDLTPAYRANRSDLDPNWVWKVIRQFLYLRDLDALVIVDRLQTDPNVPLLRRWHLNTNAAPTQQSDGSWLLNGGAVLRTLWPFTPLAPVDASTDFATIQSTLQPGQTCPRTLAMKADNSAYRLDVCTNDNLFVHLLTLGAPVAATLDANLKLTLGRHVIQLAPGLSTDRPVIDGIEVPAGT